MRFFPLRSFCQIPVRHISLAPSPPASIQNISFLQHALNQFADTIRNSRNLLVISGAGLSTESGIPDYRSPARIHSYNPIKWQDFEKSIYHRRRYWARSTLGYGTQMKVAQPNAAHHILSKWKLLEEPHCRMRLITQNVDSLHLKASFPLSSMIELHGSLREVECLECRGMMDRDEFQTMLKKENHDFYQRFTSSVIDGASNKMTIRPDGDIDLQDTDYETFRIPKCKYCNASNSIRPNIVFFGENLGKKCAEASIVWAKSADCIVICGSTLQTQSSYRLLRIAKEQNPYIPVIIVNIGETRGDALLNETDLKIEYLVSDVLTQVDSILHGSTNEMVL